VNAAFCAASAAGGVLETSMCALLRFSAGGLAALLATAYVAVSAENGTSAFRPTVFQPVSATDIVVNRMNKGDRGVTIINAHTPPAGPDKPAATAREQKILEGCDPAFSPLTASAKSNFAGRCVA
jgi:hypothetical protein